MIEHLTILPILLPLLGALLLLLPPLGSSLERQRLASLFFATLTLLASLALLLHTRSEGIQLYILGN